MWVWVGWAKQGKGGRGDVMEGKGRVRVSTLHHYCALREASGTAGFVFGGAGGWCVVVLERWRAERGGRTADGGRRRTVGGEQRRVGWEGGIDVRGVDGW